MDGGGLVVSVADLECGIAILGRLVFLAEMK